MNEKRGRTIVSRPPRFLNLSSAANDTIPRKYADAVKSFTRHCAVGERRARQDGTDVVFEAAEGTEVYRLSAPYMTDVAGAVSRGLTLTLTDDGGKKNKEVYVRLEADGEWLGAEDRVYPVTIDPVFSTPVDRDRIRNCHVSSYYHGDNFYNRHLLKTGCVDDSVLMGLIMPSPMTVSATGRV